MRRTWKKVFSIFAIALTLLLFQNCAPSEFAHVQSSAEISQTPNASNGVPVTTPPINNPGNGSGTVPTPTPVAPVPVAPPPTPTPVAPPPATVPAPPVAPVVNVITSCDALIAQIGSENLDKPTIAISRSVTSFVLTFNCDNQDRSDTVKALQFDPVAFGFSIKFNTGFVLKPSSAVSLPLEGGNNGRTNHLFGRPRVSAKFVMNLPYSAAIENLGSGTVSLYCNDALAGAALTNFPNGNHPDACKNNGGAVIDGSCHFKDSCTDQIDPGYPMYTAATNGYTTCFTTKPTHRDCVKEFGASKGYVASCPLMNKQEVPAAFEVNSARPEVSVMSLYRQYRKRNPDATNYYLWVKKIKEDPS